MNARLAQGTIPAADAALEVVDLVGQAVFAQKFMGHGASGTGEAIQEDRFIGFGQLFNFVEMASQKIYRDIPGLFNVAGQKFLRRPDIDNGSSLCGFF